MADVLPYIIRPEIINNNVPKPVIIKVHLWYLDNFSSFICKIWDCSFTDKCFLKYVQVHK